MVTAGPTTPLRPHAIDEEMDRAWRRRNVDVEATRALAEQVRAAAAGLSARTIARARTLLAWVAFRDGDFDQALLIANLAIATIGRDEDAWTGRCLLVLANTCAEIGEPEQAAGYFNRTLDIAWSIGDLSLAGSATNDSAFARRGPHERLRNFRRAHDLLSESDDRAAAALARLNLGTAYAALDNHLTAQSLAQQVVHDPITASMPEIRLRAVVLRARSLLALGRLEHARTLIEGAIVAAREHPAPAMNPVRIEAAAAWNDLGLPGCSVSLLAELVDEGTLTPTQRLEVTGLLADAYAAREDWELAYRHLHDHVQRSSEHEDAMGRRRAVALEILHRTREAERVADRERVRAERLSAHVEALTDENREVREISLRDALTGLHNRRAFNDALANLELNSTGPMWPVTLTLIDVDHFKRINDTHGHVVGDQVLADLGSLLLRVARASDLAARYGGEEFAILQLRTPRPYAGSLAARLRRELSDDQWLSVDLDTRVTVSVGIATAASPSDLDLLVERADAALYKAKQDGRDRVVHALPDDADATPGLAVGRR